MPAMGIGRSTFYDTPDAGANDATVVAEMKTICDEFEAYGYRRVGAEVCQSQKYSLCSNGSFIHYQTG
jgi:hypothetical protein